MLPLENTLCQVPRTTNVIITKKLRLNHPLDGKPVLSVYKLEEKPSKMGGSVRMTEKLSTTRTPYEVAALIRKAISEYKANQRIVPETDTNPEVNKAVEAVVKRNAEEHNMSELRELQFKKDVEYEVDGVMKIIMYMMDMCDDLGVPCVVTSLTDGKHSDNSLHYSGEAVDFRTWYFTEQVLEDLAWELQRDLGSDYDVVVEKTHLHVEYDPD